MKEKSLPLAGIFLFREERKWIDILVVMLNGKVEMRTFNRFTGNIPDCADVVPHLDMVIEFNVQIFAQAAIGEDVFVRLYLNGSTPKRIEGDGTYFTITGCFDHVTTLCL